MPDRSATGCRFGNLARCGGGRLATDHRLDSLNRDGGGGRSRRRGGRRCGRFGHGGRRRHGARRWRLAAYHGAVAIDARHPSGRIAKPRTNEKAALTVDVLIGGIAGGRHLGRALRVANRACLCFGQTARDRNGTDRHGERQTPREVKPKGHVAFSENHPSRWHPARRSGASKARSSPSPLFGAEHPVARIAKSRHDISLVVQPLVDRGSHDRHVRMRRFHSGDALGRGQQA